MKKIYMIIAQKDFRDEELIEPMELFKTANYDVHIASPEGGDCKGMLGTTVTTNSTIKDIAIDENTVAILIVGGNNSPSLMNYPEVKEKVNEAKEMDLIFGAICLGPMVLAHFDLIKGLSATVYPTENSLKKLKEHNVLYINEDVVIDGNLVTANGPQSATEFGKSVLDVLKED